mgnify:CR=1 FL=1
MKKIVALIVMATCLMLLIMACGNKQLNIKEVSSIVIMNEEDNTSMEIKDAEIVEKITKEFNSFSLKKGKEIEIPPGWTYQLIWRDVNDKIVQVLGVVDEGTIGYNDHYYSISSGDIDMDFFAGLFNS